MEADEVVMLAEEEEEEVVEDEAKELDERIRDERIGR
jgi:hypothetical protein